MATNHSMRFDLSPLSLGSMTPQRVFEGRSRVGGSNSRLRQRNQIHGCVVPSLVVVPIERMNAWTSPTSSGVLSCLVEELWVPCCYEVHLSRSAYLAVPATLEMLLVPWKMLFFLVCCVLFPACRLNGSLPVVTYEEVLLFVSVLSFPRSVLGWTWISPCSPSVVLGKVHLNVCCSDLDALVIWHLLR
jgi:hypothetical protein